jgi:methylenetetrahydrofolate dehydrogenase (NADP+)/methenyltetrahydrofolate cyclohydrolase
MVARLLDGASVAAEVKDELRQRIRVMSQRGVVPGLGTILVGQDPASRSYVTGKHRDCDEVGVASASIELPATASYGDIRDAIQHLNADPAVTGFIVQLPLPPGIDTRAVLQLIDPAKDADGLHPTNLGHLVLDVDPTSPSASSPLPCTPLAILQLLQRHDVPLAGRNVAVIGRGVTVGRPLSLLLSRKGIDATITVVHSRTPDIATEVRRADIVVAAVGTPHFVQPDWIKPGAAVLDVGVTRVGTTSAGRARLAGDVHPAVADVAGWLSPNPGGVGPMTRAMLVSNVITIAEHTALKVAA